MTEQEITMNKISVVDTADSQLLRNTVEQSIKKYFVKLGDSLASNLYELVLTEIEEPLLRAVMSYTGGNQSKAAIVLGLSRGTLRKKLKIYGFIN